MLKDYCDLQIQKGIAELSKGYNLDSWRALTSVTICRIITFCKERAEEGTNMTINAFYTRENQRKEINEEIRKSLDPLELKLAER